MRLVVITSVGDGCSYAYEEVLPIEYESVEAFLIEFEETAMKHRTSSSAFEFKFAMHLWQVQNYFQYDGKKFHFFPPEVLTVDEWFEREA